MSKGTGKAGGVATRAGGRTAVRKASGTPWVKDDRAIRAGDVAVRVSVDKLTKSLNEQSKGAEAGKLAGAKRHLESGKKTTMPRATVGRDGKVDVTDGRHRIAAAKSLGKKYIYVTVPRSQAKRARKELGP